MPYMDVEMLDVVRCGMLKRGLKGWKLFDSQAQKLIWSKAISYFIQVKVKMARYKISVKGDRDYEYEADDYVSLIAMQQKFNPCFIKDTRVADNYIVRWFDLEALKYTQKSFKAKDGYADPKKAAEEYFASKEKYDKDSPSKYSVMVKAKDVFERKIFFQGNLRFFPRAIEYPEQPLPLPARIFGVWLGDGTSRKSQITNIDPVIIEEFKEYCEENGMDVRQLDISYSATTHVGVGTLSELEDVKKFIEDYKAGMNGFAISKKYGCSNTCVYKYLKMYDEGGDEAITQYFESKKVNVMLKALKDLGVLNNKHIPEIYKKNSVENRLQLLSGFIDTDGYLSNEVCYDIVQSKGNERIFDDIREVAQSLGFVVSKTYTTKKCKYKGVVKECEVVRGFICGDVEKIPVKIDYKKIKRTKERFWYPQFEITTV